MNRRLAVYLEMVQFENSVFALPFALAGVALGARGRPAAATVILAIVAVVALRTAAMAFNRIADRAFDARNPRTAGRALVTGAVAPLRAAWLCLAGLVLFFAVAAAIGRPTLALSPVFAGLALGYSWTKRFTSHSHFVLGTALALAPLGGWVATSGAIVGYPWPLSLGVALWVAGFDIVYACQDAAVDRDLGLHSVPERWGVPRALAAARWLHVGAALALLAVGPWAGLAWPYYAGFVVLAGVLALEHRAVSENDFSRIRFAFFTANSLVSTTLLAAVVVALAVER
ncbi:MAG: UbiA-like polyprenyltransferase [Thermoanaerobaculia bacterium]